MEDNSSGQAGRAICAIFAGIGAAIILGTGGAVQIYLAELISSPASSIYGTVYGQAIVKQVSIEAWLEGTIITNMLLCIIPIAIILTFIKQTKESFVALTAAITLTISAMDIYYKLTTVECDCGVRPILESIIANIAGSIVLAPVILWMFKTCSNMYLEVRNGLWKKPVALSIPILTGLFINLAIFYAVTFFYNTIPLNIDITVNAPAAGDYMIKKERNDLDPKETDFGMIVDRASKNEEIRLVAGDGFSLNMRTPSNKGYNLNITTLSGCFDIEKIKEGSQNTTEITDVRDIYIEGPGELSEIYITDTNGKITFPTHEVNQFSISSKEEKEKTLYEFSRFFAVSQKEDQEELLRYTSTFENEKLIIRIPLIDTGNEDALEFSQKLLRLKINNKPHTVSLRAKHNIPWADKVECVEAENQISAKRPYQSIDNLYLVAILVLEIKESEERKITNSIRETEVKVNPFSGWGVIRKIEPENIFANMQSGYLEGLILQEGMQQLSINSAPIVIHEANTINLADSELYAYATGRNSIRFYGTSEMAYLDQERLNKTRWESMSDTEKGLMATVLATIFLAFIGAAWKMLTKPDN